MADLKPSFSSRYVSLKPPKSFKQPSESRYYAQKANYHDADSPRLMAVWGAATAQRRASVRTRVIGAPGHPPTMRWSQELGATVSVSDVLFPVLHRNSWIDQESSGSSGCHQGR